MSKIEEIFEIVSDGHISDRLLKALRQWSTVIQLELDGERPFHLIINSGSFEIQKGSYPKPNTVVAGDATALKEVLSGVADVTHYIAAKKLRLVHGNYFDLINLSRAAYRDRR